MHLFLFLTHASTFIIVFVQYDRTSQEIFESRGDQDTQKELDMDKTTQKRKCRRTWNEPINDKNDQVFKKGYYLLSRCRIFGMGVKMTLFIYLYNLHTQVCNSDVCLYWSVQSTCTGVPPSGLVVFPLCFSRSVCWSTPNSPNHYMNGEILVSLIRYVAHLWVIKDTICYLNHVRKLWCIRISKN
jgi:hypothetical protein